jgi:hypothetical protein
MLGEIGAQCQLIIINNSNFYLQFDIYGWKSRKERSLLPRLTGLGAQLQDALALCFKRKEGGAVSAV